MDLPAKHYRKHSTLQYQLAHEALQHTQISTTSRVLDVGCGDGKITSEFAQIASQGRCIGVDASFNMIQLAKDSFPHMNFFCMKAEDMVLDQTFTHVTCLSCLHWIQEPEKALTNMINYLEKGGEIIILTFIKSRYAEVLEQALKMFPEYLSQSSLRKNHSLRDYADILKSLGCTMNVCHSKELIAHYSNSSQLKDYIKGWLVSYVPLPESLQDLYLEEVAKISQIYADSNQEFHIPYKTGIIKATKNIYC